MSADRAAVTVFVGSYAAANDDGIHVFHMNPASGALSPLGAFGGIENPSFLLRHPTRDWLYAVSETGDGAVHSLKIERAGSSIGLTGLNHRPSAGDHPCHLAIDRDGRWLAVSNYSSGTVAVFPIRDDGTLGESTSVARHEGSGPNRQRQEGPHAHATAFTPDNRFLLAADLGIDQLVIYAFDPAAGTLAHHRGVPSRPGAGPRHLAFHPDGTHVFVVNELDNTLTLWRFAAGDLVELQTVSTVPPDSGDSTAGALRLSPSGSRIYVSNRGHDSLAVFTFEPSSGLTHVTTGSCGGTWPRDFTVLPDGRHAIVANRRSNEVTVLEVGDARIGPVAGRVPVTEPSSIALD